MHDILDMMWIDMNRIDFISYGDFIGCEKEQPEIVQSVDKVGEMMELMNG